MVVVTDAMVSRLESIVGKDRGRGVLRRALILSQGDENRALDRLFREEDEAAAEAAVEEEVDVGVQVPKVAGSCKRVEAEQPNEEMAEDASVQISREGSSADDESQWIRMECDKLESVASGRTMLDSRPVGSRMAKQKDVSSVGGDDTTRESEVRYTSQKLASRRFFALPFNRKISDQQEEHLAWPRSLGSFVVTAFSTSSGDGLIHLNEEVELRVTNTSQGKQRGLSRRGRSTAASGGQLGIIRFGKREVSGNGQEYFRDFGRLPADFAKFLAPLMILECVHLTATVIHCPSDRLTFNAPIELHILVLVRRCAFPKDGLAVRTFSDTGAAESDSELQKRNALAALLSALGILKVEIASAPRSVLTGSKRKSAESDGDVSNTTELKEEEIEKFYDNRDDLLASYPQREEEWKSIFGEQSRPQGLSSVLRDYQRYGVCWMIQKEKIHDHSRQQIHPLWETRTFRDGGDFYVNTVSGAASLEFPAASADNRGGILADEMGLGKTVEVIATILANKDSSSDDDGNLESFLQAAKHPSAGEVIRGGTLVICPMSMLQQWIDEFDNHVVPGFLRVSSFYGSDRRRNGVAALGSDNIDVIVTTYGTLAAELDVPDSPLFRTLWSRVVLDEAHHIKGQTTKTAKAAFHLLAHRKWAVTGTPIQNQLNDLFALLHFLQIDPWADFSLWNMKILKPFESGSMEEKVRACALVRSIVTPIMLRRRKNTRNLEGNPIVQLPEKHLEVIKLQFTQAERDFYDALFEKSKTKFDTFVRQGKVMANLAHVLEILLRLRQCCDHPFLVTSAPSKDLKAMQDLEKLGELFTGEKAFVRNVLDDVQGVQSLECSICLEVMEDAVFTSCAHSACRECVLSLFGKRETASCHVCRGLIRRDEIITAPRASRFSVDIVKNWVPSVKLHTLVTQLDIIRDSRMSNPAQHGKVVVFSQWTGCLDLVEVALTRSSHTFLRLDGSMSQKDRSRTLTEFRKDELDGPQILLVSLKAGGVGLNLTIANHVFMIDQWWNPAVEDQAIDRVHRIGQEREVFVRRFVIENSVEERLLAIQEKKRNIAEGALALSSEERKKSRLEDVMFLFS
eukprot:CAMPEP_0184681504 /NCGR_PEP_ID=MMETSP0312-20130426/4497_1 /TAXON_ID=31354 /ORGANISM="Compsopogon coeruleus, Strain SAG 36.94" /LENGTH=1081 /DNA_ID=CAMNT_0027132403 /DNA_START=149 /DNA_END=3394 /DNA_ORIENTATION=-